MHLPAGIEGHFAPDIIDVSDSLRKHLILFLQTRFIQSTIAGAKVARGSEYRGLTENAMDSGVWKMFAEIQR
jgi:hypothetical protein